MNKKKSGIYKIESPFLKKRLSQHILIDNNIKRKIIQQSKIAPDENVFEIGAGTGVLTSELAKKAKKVIAVEVDKTMCEILKDKLKNFENIELHCCDIFDFDLSKYRNIKVIGNVPYNITTHIIEYLISNIESISNIYITVQKEVAKRIIASKGNKNFGSLSLYVQYYSQARILFDISKNCFRPIPKVDSVFLQLFPLKRKGEIVIDEATFFKIIRHCFSQRRKKLQNSLKRFFPEGEILKIFKKLGIREDIRPDQINLKSYQLLLNELLS